MKKKIAIIGAGGFGREIAFLLERIGTWDIIGFFDDAKELKGNLYGYNVIGDISSLASYSSELNVVCAVGSSIVRRDIIKKIIGNEKLIFPNIIDPTVICGKDIKIGKGNIICAGTTITVNVNLGDFNIINLHSTIGHDVIMKSYNTLYPSVNISGSVITGDFVEFGTGTRVIQNLSIGENVIIGAGSTVIRDIPSNSLSVGSPAKVIRERDKINI